MPPEVQPVYLVVPSRSHSKAPGVDPTIADFVDSVAVHPAIAERVLLSVCEYSNFVNELAPLGTRLEDTARVVVSGFDGVSYAAMFEELATQLEYDRYQFSGPDLRMNRPLVVVILESAPSPDDEWQIRRCSLTQSGDEMAPAVAAVATVAADSALAPLAEAMAFPTRHSVVAPSRHRAGESAASIVIGTFASGESAPYLNPRVAN